MFHMNGQLRNVIRRFDNHMKSTYVVTLVVICMTSCVGRKWLPASAVGEYEHTLQTMRQHMGEPAEIFSSTTLQGYPGKHEVYRYFLVGDDRELRCHEVFFKGDVWVTTLLLGPSAYESKGSCSQLKDKVRLRLLTKQELSDPEIKLKIELLLSKRKSIPQEPVP